MLEHLDWFPNALQKFENATNAHPNYATEIAPERTPGPEAEPNETEPSTSVIVVQPTPETETAAPVTPQSSALTQTSPPHAIFITVTKPAKITIGRRDEIILPGNESSARGPSGGYRSSAIQGRINVCKNILNGFEVATACPGDFRRDTRKEGWASARPGREESVGRDGKG
jgi:hypothetical protein